VKSMKRFKKKGFWVFYLAIAFAGGLIIVAFGLQNQSPVIPNVNAQVFTGGLYPSDAMFSYSGISQGARYGVSPQNVLFNFFPGDVAFQPQAAYFPADIMFPGDIIGKSDGKTKMRTILTCSGCALTMSTCEWNCGVTFSQCGSRAGQGSIPGLFGGNYTFGTCPTSTTCGSSLFGSCSGGSYTFGTCPGTSLTTLMTCSGGIFCGGGGSTTFTTCGSNLIGCGIIGGNTLSTCIGCRYEPQWKPIEVDATRWQSCGTFQMHINPGLPSGYSTPPAL
jgi:hypothetical protein